jgi:hypothetical protein
MIGDGVGVIVLVGVGVIVLVGVGVLVGVLVIGVLVGVLVGIGVGVVQLKPGGTHILKHLELISSFS